MTKISLLPEDTNPTTDDYTVSVDTTSDTTKKTSWLNVGKMLSPAILISHAITPQMIAPASTPSAGGSTITPDITKRMFIIAGLATATTLNIPTGGTPDDGQGLTIRISDNGTAQTIAYNGIYKGIGVTPPSTTVVGQTIYMSLSYNSENTTWDIVSVARG